jgi:hypothetical protein
MGWFDESLYPDEPGASSPRNLEERIEFIARLCGAWDFGILPRGETISEIRAPEWRPAIEECRLLSSISYHLLRRWHHLPVAPFLGSIPAVVRLDPELARV